KSVDFTSDHNVLINNTTNILTKDGPRYESPEFVRPQADKKIAGRSNPISQTRNTSLAVKVTIESQGMPGDLDVRVRATSTTSAMNFQSAVVKASTLPQGISITATNGLGPKVQVIEGEISWFMDVMQNGQVVRTISLDKSG